MPAKLLIVAVFAAIVVALGSAMVSLVRSRSQDDRTVKSLTVRIALSVVLFLFLFFAYFMGWIAPHDLPR